MVISNFGVQETTIDGVKIVTPFCTQDNRGCFVKYYEESFFSEMSEGSNIAECFESLSVKNVIRGIHFQYKNPQEKIVHISQGSVYDVVVDLRKDSPTYKKWIAIELNDNNHIGVFIPKGCGHGFKVTSEYALMSYYCIGKYDAESDSGIVWNDVVLGVDWKLCNPPIISERDAKLLTFSDFEELCAF